MSKTRTHNSSLECADQPLGDAIALGLPPFIDRHLYTSGYGSIYRSRMSHLTVPHPNASVEERHRSREFVGFLQKLDAAYPSSTAIKLILDNHSAHISKETKAWLDAQPEGRFTFVFTPKHGSWLNLVEGFFSKLARSTLRHIRVASKKELKDRIIAAIDDINRDPVVHTWTYKINDVA